MKLRVFIIAAAIVLLAACSPHTETGVDDGIKIISTIYPMYDFATQVTGGIADVEILIPHGVDSHSYEPSPKDIISIQKCDVFLYMGGESEAWVEGILADMDSEVRAVRMMDIVELYREEEHEGHDHGHGQEFEYDEHIWTSPKNAMLIVDRICDEICAEDAENSEIYQDNTKAYKEALSELDRQLSDISATASCKTLVFADRFPFRYLVEDYGFSYVAAFPGCSSETEASSATVALLIDKVSEENIPVVFYTENSNQQLADTICSETGAEKAQLHSCHNLTTDELAMGKNYVTVMSENIAALAKATK